MAQWKVQLEATCAAMGTCDGATYIKEEDCLECVKDLMRLLRRDDDTHVLRRSLGCLQVVKTDLIPIVKHYHHDAELFDMAIRLMVNLTVPELVLFREELPEEKITRNYYLQLQSHRQAYKLAFVDEKLWAVLSSELGKLLRKDFDQRSEDDRLMMEKMLILVRNILQVPRDCVNEKRADNDVSVHDQILWVLHKSGMEDLLLYVASSDDEHQFCLHILEIISLMFREQDPKHLAKANFQRSKEEKAEDEMALLRLRQQELQSKKLKLYQLHSSRHSRFGGTFTVNNVKSISERDLIYHKPLASVHNIDFDKAKTRKKVAKNRVMPADEDLRRRSTLSIRLFLKEFCLEFLHGAYNKLMAFVKDYLTRKKSQQNDEAYYLWALKFFMEFNRVHKFRVDLVTETLNKATFHYVHQQIEDYRDNFEHEKKNRPIALIWVRRMHLGVRAYQELLLNLVAMCNAQESLREAAITLRADVFYEPEYRELCLQQISLYSPDKMSLAYLRDLVETTHIFLKIMENMAKNKHLMVSKKTKRRKRPKQGKAASTGTEGTRRSNEDHWDGISSELSQLLQDPSSHSISETVVPFDAASEVPIDDQRSAAMFRIQAFLKQGLPSQALALLRASREVWTEDEAFGATDADAEDEFMMLREILFAVIPRPQHLGNESLDARPEDDGKDSEALTDDENEEYEEEEPSSEFFSVEQEFEWKAFMGRFATKNVCSAYARLFAHYNTNTDFTNLCLIKMFHRIAFDCSLPSMLFHVSIFHTLQRVHHDFRLMPDCGVLKDMVKFGKCLLAQFFGLCSKNQHIYMELCFWPNNREATEIMEGYGTQALSKKSHASFWCEEDEEQLQRVFHQLKEMAQNDKNPSDQSGDLLDQVSAFFLNSGKSRRQVARKLKEMKLISDIKEVTKKPLKLAARSWTDGQIQQLTSLYSQFKDAVDPIGRIMDHLGPLRKPRKRIVDKIMDLGLCEDRKKLMKKRTRKGLAEKNLDVLQPASETDSALEDSSSGSGSQSDMDDSEEDSDELHALVSDLEAAMQGGEAVMIGLRWLSQSLEEEADDREGEDDECSVGVPLVATNAEIASVLESQAIKSVMKRLQLAAPGNEQEQYWRIPPQLKPADLRAKAALLSQAAQGQFDLSKLEPYNLIGRSVKQRMPAQKRGPNKWMPIRRHLDNLVMERIVDMFPKNSPPKKGRSKGTSKSKKKTTERVSQLSSPPRPTGQGSSDEERQASPRICSKAFLDSDDDDSDSSAVDPRPSSYSLPHVASDAESVSSSPTLGMAKKKRFLRSPSTQKPSTKKPRLHSSSSSSGSNENEPAGSLALDNEVRDSEPTSNPDAVASSESDSEPEAVAQMRNRRSRMLESSDSE